MITGAIGAIGGYDPTAAYTVTYRPATPAEKATGEVKSGDFVREDADVQKSSDDSIAKSAKKGECQTCKNRKYVDGSDENVSFKSAAKINPNAVYARVRGHEQEHVANAYDKAEQQGGKVLHASVAIHYATCPECGRRYVSGGTTSTMIRYPKDNAYGSNKKAFEAEATKGNNIDFAV